MSGQTIDYAALAAKHGGALAGPAVDYDALAAKHGGSMVSSEPEDQSFLHRAATQPSQFGHLNPLRYLDEIGQGMAQLGEQALHPIDTAKAAYKSFNSPVDWDKEPLPSAGDVADFIAKGYGQEAAGGVLGKAVEKGAPVISDVAQASARKMGQAADVVRNVTPKQAVQAVAGTSAGVATAAAGHPWYSPASAGASAATFGKVAEMLLGKDRANAPIFARNPELSLDNINDALAQTIAADRARFQSNQANSLGQIPQTGAKPAAQTGEALATAPQSSVAQQPTPKGGTAPRFTAADRAAAQSLLQDALKQHSADVVEAAVPQAQNRGANLHTQAQVDFFLKRGDVAGAENALDTAAKQANPAYTPPNRLRLKDSLDKLGNIPEEATPNGPVSWKGSMWEYKGGQFLKDGQVLDKSDDIADALAALSQKDYFGGKTIEGQTVEPKSLNLAAQRANPLLEPRRVVPTTDDIRQAVQQGTYQPQVKQSIGSKSRAELLEDKGIQQEMGADLQMHGWSAEQEAQREFIARNSTDFTKTGEGGFSGSTRTTPAFYTARAVPGKAGNLLDLLNQSLAQARRAKGQK